MGKGHGHSSHLSSPWSYCAVVVTLIIFILWDVYRAWKRRAHWVPAKCLVLSALTIQLLAVIDDRSVSSKGSRSKDQSLAVLPQIQLVIDSGGLVRSVFIAYSIPDIARFRSYRSKKTLGIVGALVISVLFHWFGVATKEPSSKWFKVLNTTSSVTVILLILLLICAFFAGRSIRRMVRKKISFALSCCYYRPTEERKCQITEHVLKCWIVARACQPDYIIARSELSSLAGILVTICVLMFILKLIVPHTGFNFHTLSLAKKAVLVIEGLFALIGWIIVLFRWMMAVRYFPGHCHASSFQLEDFWTSSINIEVLRQFFKASGIGGLFRKKITSEMNNYASGDLRKVRIIVCGHLRTQLKELTVSCLLKLTVFTVFCLVSISKICWFLSVKAFRIKFIPSSCVNTSSINQFHRYNKTLNRIRMPRETAWSLWIANETAFKGTEKQVALGVEEGRKCKILKTIITIIRQETKPLEDEPLQTSRRIIKYFKCVQGKKSWRRRSISLIHFIIYFYDGTNSDVVDNAIQAYIQAKDLIEFVEKDEDLEREAADADFIFLFEVWQKHLKSRKKKQSPHSNQFEDCMLECKIKIPLEQCMDNLSQVEIRKNIKEDLRDPTDWRISVAGKIGLYNLWKVIDRDSLNSVDKLYNHLADVIAHCIKNELPKALIKKCSKWAMAGQEEEIFYAAFIAGKYQGVTMDQSGEEPICQCGCAQEEPICQCGCAQEEPILFVLQSGEPVSVAVDKIIPEAGAQEEPICQCGCAHD